MCSPSRPPDGGGTMERDAICFMSRSHQAKFHVFSTKGIYDLVITWKRTHRACHDFAMLHGNRISLDTILENEKQLSFMPGMPPDRGDGLQKQAEEAKTLKWFIFSWNCKPIFCLLNEIYFTFCLAGTFFPLIVSKWQVINYVTLIRQNYYSKSTTLFVQHGVPYCSSMRFAA